MNRPPWFHDLPVPSSYSIRYEMSHGVEIDLGDLRLVVLHYEPIWSDGIRRLPALSPAA